jgi:hypothetical protein
MPRIILFIMSLALFFYSVPNAMHEYNTMQEISVIDSNQIEVITKNLELVATTFFRKFITDYQYSADEGEFADELSRAEIQNKYRSFIRDHTYVHKLRLFNLFGYVTFSTDPSEIGSALSNKHVRSAFAGEKSTEHAETDELELLEVYTPVYLGNGDTKEISAVMEVYYIVSPKNNHKLIMWFVVVAVAFIIFFLTLEPLFAAAKKRFLGVEVKEEDDEKLKQTLEEMKKNLEIYLKHDDK